MSSFKSPAYNVKAVPVEKIVANSYNPNVVAPPEMKLLELVHLGRRLHDAPRVLLPGRRGYLRAG